MASSKHRIPTSFQARPKWILFAILPILAVILSAQFTLGVLLDASQYSDDELIVKSVPQLIESFGYPVEEHEVITEDGYILNIHRIPHRRSEAGNVEDEDSAEAVAKEKKIPVLLGHCLVGSSAIYAFGPRENSLAYVLADQGYDVWMNNIRGNSYGKRHQTLDYCPTCSEFWSFGFDESARYDYSATIDYILEETGAEQVYFAGYSMATAQYLILLAERPEYNDKIRAGFLLGPTALMGNATNPMIKLADQAELMRSAFQLIGMDEFMPNFLEVKSKIFHKTCRASYMHKLMCRNLFGLIVGSDPGGIDHDHVHTYMSQLPAGASLTTFVHFAQLFRNGGRFTKFDHGTIKNLMTYGSPEPPEYDLGKVTAATVIYGGEGDGFAVPADVDKLAAALPNLLASKMVDKAGFSHLDFIISKDAGKLIYNDIAAIMKSLDEGEDGGGHYSSDDHKANDASLEFEDAEGTCNNDRCT